jgi:hypothetical protein
MFKIITVASEIRYFYVNSLFPSAAISSSMVLSSKPNRCIPVSNFIWIGKWYKFFLFNFQKAYNPLNCIFLVLIGCWIIAEKLVLLWIKYHNSNVIPPFLAQFPHRQKPHLSNQLCDARVICDFESAIAITKRFYHHHHFHLWFQLWFVKI